MTIRAPQASDTSCVNFTPDRSLIEDNEIPLAIRAKSGDEKATNDLIDLLYKRVLAYSSKQLNDRRDAEEVTQDVFSGPRLQNTLNRYENGNRIINLFFNNARQAAKDLMRKAHREKRDLRQTTNLKESDTVSLADFKLSQYKMRARLYEAISMLPIHHARVILVTFIVGCTTTEGIKKLGIGRRTLEKRKREGLQLLKKLVHEECPEPEFSNKT